MWLYATSLFLTTRIIALYERSRTLGSNKKKKYEIIFTRDSCTNRAASTRCLLFFIVRGIYGEKCGSLIDNCRNDALWEPIFEWGLYSELNSIFKGTKSLVEALVKVWTLKFPSIFQIMSLWDIRVLNRVLKPAWITTVIPCNGYNSKKEILVDEYCHYVRK